MLASPALLGGKGLFAPSQHVSGDGQSQLPDEGSSGTASGSLRFSAHGSAPRLEEPCMGLESGPCAAGGSEGNLAYPRKHGQLPNGGNSKWG